MSYPPPPPPGQGGQGPYPPNPYATGAGPYGQPPKKQDNTLWWVLGAIGVVVILCCIGVCGFFAFAANEADKAIDSATSSYGDARAAGATPVSQGEEVTDNGATVTSGWRVTATDELSGVTLRNDGSSRNMLRVTFFFMKDGSVLEDATCSSDFLDPGESDYSPTCFDPISSIEGHDEIRVAEGS